jgi:hypothetical protein
MSTSQVADALERWFISQEVSPKDASCIMLHLMARELVRQERDPTKLVEAINNAGQLLGVEVAQALNNT